MADVLSQPIVPYFLAVYSANAEDELGILAHQVRSPRGAPHEIGLDAVDTR